MRKLSEMASAEREQIFVVAKAMYATGAWINEIASKLGVTRDSFKHLVISKPDDFPPRGRNQKTIARRGDAESGPKLSYAKVHKRAFLPLPGTQPASYLYSDGCKWPIALACEDPFKAVLNEHVCGQPRIRRGDHLQPWCSDHYRISTRGF